MSVILTANTQSQNKPVFCAGLRCWHLFDGDSHDPALFEKTVDALANLKPVVIGANQWQRLSVALLIWCWHAICALVCKVPNSKCLPVHWVCITTRMVCAVTYLFLGINGSKQAFLTARPIPVEKFHEWYVFIDVCPSRPRLMKPLQNWQAIICHLCHPWL